jgi:hypothetical protein
MRITYFLLLSHQIKGTFNLADTLVGNMCIAQCGFQITIPEQLLNETDVGTVFQKMGRTAQQ